MKEVALSKRLSLITASEIRLNVSCMVVYNLLYMCMNNGQELMCVKKISNSHERRWAVRPGFRRGPLNEHTISQFAQVLDDFSNSYCAPWGTPSPKIWRQSVECGPRWSAFYLSYYEKKCFNTRRPRISSNNITNYYALLCPDPIRSPLCFSLFTKPSYSWDKRAGACCRCVSYTRPKI